MLSDTHFDEVVKAAEMNYVNAYNRRIADLRLETYFSNDMTRLFRTLFYAALASFCSYTNGAR